MYFQDANPAPDFGERQDSCLGRCFQQKLDDALKVGKPLFRAITYATARDSVESPYGLPPLLRNIRAHLKPHSPRHAPACFHQLAAPRQGTARVVQWPLPVPPAIAA